MIKKLRPLITLLALGAVMVGIWSVVTDDIAAPETEGIAADGTWQADFEGKGATTDYVVRFSVDGASSVDDLVLRGFNSVDCNDALHCRGHATLAGDALRLVIDPIPAGATIDIEGIDTVRQIRQAPFDGRWLNRLFLLALAFVPIIVLTHRRVALSQWLLIAFSVSALSALQFGFTLMLLGILLGFFAIGRWYRASDKRSSRFILTWLAITALILLILKNFKAIFLVSFEDYGSLALVLPLGTSYFLIRLLDLQLRWHRGQLEDLNLRRYLVYVLFPPTLVAGPIELVDSFFKNRAERITRLDLSDGAMRITVGVAKKLVIVDGILGGLLFESGLWSRVVTDPTGDPWDVVRFCLLAYLLAYLDFSAYSDIAIGLARLFGYTIGENFRWPVLAPDLAEFWRRWHISLSGWAFRNVFFPVIATTRNQSAALIVTLVTIAMWHDLALTWVTWGLYHGIGMAVLAWWPWHLVKEGRLRTIGGTILTNLYVAGGFAFVTIRDYSLAWTVFYEFVTAPIQLLL
ncbi:MAG: MBOAT family O-acyltransferase [Acidimicrobiales bacterium]